MKFRVTFGKIFGIVYVALTIYALAGFFVLPPIVKSVLENKLSEALHRKVTIRDMDINPFVLSLEIRGFTAKEREGPGVFASFDKLFLNLQSMSLVRQGIILREITLVKPHADLVRQEDSEYNFSDLIEKEEKPFDKRKPVKFSLNNISIVDGSLDFHDRPRDKKHTIRQLDVAIPFISNVSYYIEDYVKPQFSALINGSPLELYGQTKPFAESRETSFEFDVKGIDLPYYLAYLPFDRNFEMPSGFADAKLILTYTEYEKKPPTIRLLGDFSLRKIRVTATTGEHLISLARLDVSISSLEIISRKAHLEKVLLEAPSISLRRERSGKFNLLEILPERETAKEEIVKKPGEASFSVDADEILVHDGKIIFGDLVPERPFSTTLEKIEVNIEHFSNEKDKKTAVNLSFKSEAGESFSLDGGFSVIPPASEGTFDIEDLLIGKYSSYYRDKILFEIEEGTLAVNSRFNVDKSGDETGIKVSAMASTLTSLRLKKEGGEKDFLTIPSLSISGTDMDLNRKEVVVGGLSSEKGDVLIKRSADGAVNILGLFPHPPGNIGEQGPESRPQGPPWKVAVDQIALEDYSVTFEDESLDDPVKLNIGNISLKGKHISTEEGRKGDTSLSFVINDKGKASLNGKLGINPSSADLRADLKKISVVPFQPYFTKRVKILVTSGDASAKGNISLRYSKADGLEAEYKGDASLTDFASVDKLNADDFLKWDSLYFSDMDIHNEPLSVDIRQIAMSDFYSRLIIHPDGSFNVQGIVTPAEEEKSPKSNKISTSSKTEGDSAGGKKERMRNILINTLTLQGGEIDFTDNYIKPNFSAKLLDMGGRVSGLSSREDALADVELQGSLGTQAPLDVTGKINPLRKNLYLDLKAVFKNFDLSPLTPYSSRYAGYTIGKGKLFLTLHYKIVKTRLDAKNNILLDQFTLGEKVDSPDATKLPVKLAIALLKNRKGEIHLDIPVEGDLDNPKFSIGSVILKIIGNLLLKAATSPFALLASIFGGGGEELSYVEFDYGSFSPNAEAQKKLDKIAEALYERPGLELEIEGHVDIEKDRESLKEYLFNKKIKAEKLKEMVKSGGPSVTVDEVTISEEEYPKYLKKAYKEADFPKPRNFLGMLKSLPVPEMEKLMRTHIVITEDDLRELASERAREVRDYVLKAKEIAPERIFLVEPDPLQPENKENMKNSRVDFALK
jgi:uncharacterized protein involved in outer membrane biogenesis